MAILPVWCEGWALGCCGNSHSATIGNDWSPSLFARIDDYEPTGADLGWTAVDDDDVAIVGETRYDEKRSPQPFIDLGTFFVAASQFVQGRFKTTTRIYYDWHADIHPGLNEMVTVDGVVKEVLLRQPIFEQRPGERVRVVVGYKEPKRMGTTFDWPHLDASAVVRLELDPNIIDVIGPRLRGRRRYAVRQALIRARHRLQESVPPIQSPEP